MIIAGNVQDPYTLPIQDAAMVVVVIIIGALALVEWLRKKFK